MIRRDKKTSEIRISYNETLDPVFAFYSQYSPLGKKLGWDSWQPPTKEEIVKNIQRYRKIWKPFEKPFFDMMEKITSAPCINKIIDIHIVSGNPRQIGFPIIIRSGFSDEKFVITLIHELIHYYIHIHNLPESFVNKKNARETKLTRKHIVVFSIMKYFFNDIMKQPQLITSAKEISDKHSTKEYTQAWNEAENNYFKIIKTFEAYATKKMPKY
ncbi:hypothetical protein C4565_01025 [Candidatus Parcubacteria bacterium]|nr:MAG: hypothetical protein C4565_01025 [Candidatus Parcubacteria bacterium]